MTVSAIPLGLYSANCYVLCDVLSGEGVVIDPGEFCEDLISFIKEAGVKELKYILLTHGHFDHILGVNRLKEYFPDAKTAIGAPDKICLSSVEDNLMGSEYKDSFFEIQADFLLFDGDCIEVGSGRLKVISTPGHSKGGVCFVSAEDKFVITGDTLFYRTAGRTDFKGGSFEQLSASVDRLMLLDDDYVVYPGHNKSTVIGEERTRNRFIRNR